ncbi:SDR family NAD(P)-dependent oxidoreductase [Sphingomonas sp. BAUL-RG-20F-R05-02]|uniref:SDR family NAD(P)-dependent oxidoreductase n=1 Tax=Sphingomonas sp. BAUL-RG-20F-R05-02 TaxID=2914830 RepID=UPI001F56A76D|nr:SDR family NAD(P)-dependent oxidoreductase [Sphingomonas sp. BAUL-RG-20F-R05-02]
MAVITGAASGIGLAVVTRLAEAGMRVALADLPGAVFEDPRSHAAAEGGDIHAITASAVQDPVQFRGLACCLKPAARQMNQSLVPESGGRSANV